MSPGDGDTGKLPLTSGGVSTSSLALGLTSILLPHNRVSIAMQKNEEGVERERERAYMQATRHVW